jgi:hypothetical protein
MTSSAVDLAAQSDRLARTLDLYRDLTVALRDRITLLKAGTGRDDACKAAEDAVREHRRVLTTVLEIEAKLGIRSKEWAVAGGTGELDLDAARAEIVARLAVRASEG